MKSYKFQILRGTFSKEEALGLLTKMVDVKIKHHENKIQHSDNEEDIKMRESRIKQLQKDLYEARKAIDHRRDNIELNAEISLS